MPRERKGLTLAFGLWFHFCLIILTLIFGGTALVSSFFDQNGIISQCMGRWWGRSLLWLARTPVVVEGRENLVPGQPYIFAANHRSAFDIYLLICLLPGKILWVAKQSLFVIPVFGQAIYRMGSVPIDRSNRQAAVRSLNCAAERIRAGASMIIFPEGTRGAAPELLPFKKGVFLMAMKAGQPIVPVSISGARAIQPRGTIRVRPGPVRVVLSPPIHPGDFRNKDELMAAVRQAIAAHYDPYFPYGPGDNDG